MDKIMSKEDTGNNDFISEKPKQKTINQKKITDSAFKKALQENLLKRKKATKNRTDIS